MKRYTVNVDGDNAGSIMAISFEDAAKSSLFNLSMRNCDTIEVSRIILGKHNNKSISRKYSKACIDELGSFNFDSVFSYSNIKLEEKYERLAYRHESIYGVHVYKDTFFIINNLLWGAKIKDKMGLEKFHFVNGSRLEMELALSEFEIMKEAISR